MIHNYNSDNCKEILWGLTTVGKYLGTEKMIEQIKPEWVDKLYHYLQRYFLNTHGMDQDAEMKAWKYQQEGAELGWKYLNALNDAIYKLKFKQGA